MHEEHEPNLLPEIVALRQAVAILNTNVAVLTQATEMINKSIESLQSDTVRMETFKSLEVVVKGHTKIFERVTWFVVLSVLGSLLVLVLHANGGMGG